MSCSDKAVQEARGLQRQDGQQSFPLENLCCSCREVMYSVAQSELGKLFGDSCKKLVKLSATLAQCFWGKW